MKNLVSCVIGRDSLSGMGNGDDYLAECSGLGPLRVWWDDTPRSAAMNMAIDEVLVRQMVESESGDQIPILRYYDWARPSVSIGYFQLWKETVDPKEIDEVDLMRRWTGGGRVDHREDLTYTLVVPREHPFFFLPPADNYHWVHNCVVMALERIGRIATVTATGNKFLPRRGESPNCFDSPVQFDVVNDEGGKLAGAAQRRTRWGLLHQGSVIEPGLAENRRDWEEALSDLLSGEEGRVIEWQLPPSWLEQAEELCKEKYASADWLRKF